MRAVLHQDIVALARSMMTVPLDTRRDFAGMIVQLADAADRYRQKVGTAHPVFGDGTLASCCDGYPNVPERRLDDLDYAECLIAALEAVLRFRMNDQHSRGEAVRDARDEPR